MLVQGTFPLVLSFLAWQCRLKVSGHFKQRSGTFVLDVLFEACNRSHRRKDWDFCKEQVRGVACNHLHVPILSGNSPGGSALARVSTGWKNRFGKPSDNKLKISSTERGNSLLAKIVPRNDFCFTSTDSFGCNSGTGEV